MEYWNCSPYLLFEKHKKPSRINPNIYKYREFVESLVLVLDTRSNTIFKYGTNFFIIIFIIFYYFLLIDADR